jgi:hypothetical protein
MKYTDRPEFKYDPAMAALHDTNIALRLHDDYVSSYAPRVNGVPAVIFYEVDHSPGKIDPLWHQPIAARTEFSRTLTIPAIANAEKPDWRLKATGLVPTQVTRFWLSNLGLQKADYFPARGDQVSWVGYRYGITEVVVAPEAYWGQTGVWLGLYVRAVIVPEGDAPPVPNAAVLVPAEQSHGAVTSR